MSREEILALPATTDVVTAGRALGLGRGTAYQLVAAGEFPCKVLTLGTRYRVVTADLLRVLGIDDDGPRNGDGLARPAQLHEASS
jgi:hypothetical protein